MSEPQPRSARLPWIRTGLMGLVPLLLPFVWVLELDSCGNAPTAHEITGTMVVSRFTLEGWLVLVPVVLLLVLTPFLAPRVQRLGLRVLIHLLGLVAAVVAGWGAFFAMFFTIFTERTGSGVGWVVVGAFTASLIDALLRVLWSTQEWLRARTALRTASS